MGIPAPNEDALTALTDTAYMVFGWWEERPDNTATMYNIDVFGEGTGLVDGTSIDWISKIRRPGRWLLRGNGRG